MLFTRILAISLAVLTLLCAVTGCSASRALPSTDEDLTVVGTVGEYEVLYEELRFLVLTYKQQLEAIYGEGLWESEALSAKYRNELKELVYNDIEANYAVLTLAAKEGISIEDYDDEVQEYMDSAMDEDFGGDRAAYKDFLMAMSVTDHYLRFTAGVDAVYEDLYYAYLGTDRLPDAEDTVKQYILQNFVYVASICLINKTDAESEENREKAEQYRAEVAGGADILDYVKYTLDLSPEHCFTYGQMDETFEKQAFALENVGDVSEVFLGTADYLGDTRSAWYFLQRFDLTADYVEDNYEILFDQYTSAKMNDYLTETKESLVFVPNDYCKSLDFLAIEPIDEIEDDTWVYVLLGIGGAILVIGGGIVLFKVLNRKPAPVKKNGKR